MRGESGKERFWLQHEELDSLDPSEIHAWRSPHAEHGEYFKFPIADGQSNCLEEIRFSENPPQYGIDPKEAKSAKMIFEENRTSLIH